MAARFNNQFPNLPGSNNESPESPKIQIPYMVYDKDKNLVDMNKQSKKSVSLIASVIIRHFEKHYGARPGQVEWDTENVYIDPKLIPIIHGKNDHIYDIVLEDGTRIEFDYEPDSNDENDENSNHEGGARKSRKAARKSRKAARKSKSRKVARKH